MEKAVPVPRTPAAKGDQLEIQYPQAVPPYKSALYHGAELSAHLGEAPPRCFSREEDNGSISVRVIDLYSNERGYQSSTQQLCDSAKKVKEAIETARKPRIRIIIVHSKRTVSPLQITTSLMQHLLDTYNVSAEFVPIIYSFGETSDLAENGNTTLCVHADGRKSQQLCYEMRYVEENFRSSQAPWSPRHTGVYHAHDAEAKSDLFLLVQGVQNSTAELRLLDMIRPQHENMEELHKLCEDPFRIHLLLATSYLLNWRWYLRTLAQQFRRMNDNALTFQFEEAATGAVTFELIQNLRNVHDKVMSAMASCKGDAQVLEGILALDEAYTGDMRQLNFLSKQLEGFIDSSEVLCNRIRNTIDLIGYSLDHHAQLKAAKNSATITIITWVSAVYLPGNFTASLYGMNFFEFGANSIIISEDFWIFIVTWVPLMLLTAGLYYAVALWQHRRIRRPRIPRQLQWASRTKTMMHF